MPNKLREIAEHIKTFDALGLPQKRGRKPSALYAKIHAKVEDSIKRTGNKRYAKIADDLGLDMSGNEIKKAYDRHRRQIEILFEGQRIRNAKANKPSR